MKIKEMLVFVLLAAGIVAAFGGIALISRGETYGWLGIVLAGPMLFTAQRSMRVAPARG